MAYYNGATTNPTLATQIGYSFTETLNGASCNGDSQPTQAYTTFTVPVGVWIMTTNNITAAVNSNNFGTIEAAVQFYKNPSLIPLASSGYKSIEGFNYMTLSASTTFYSTGQTQIMVGLTVTSVQVVSNITGSVTLTKIA